MPGKLTPTCDRCCIDRAAAHVEHTCEPADGTEKTKHVECLSVGACGFIIDRVRLAEVQPVLRYFTWEAYIGPLESRETIAEGFARDLEEARKLAHAVIATYAAHVEV